MRRRRETRYIDQSQDEKVKWWQEDIQAEPDDESFNIMDYLCSDD